MASFSSFFWRPAELVTQYLHYLKGYHPVSSHEEPHTEESAESQGNDGDGLTMREDLVQEPKSSTFHKWWEKTGLDSAAIKFMLKGALPPIIALALYQIDGYAETYTTQGFLVSVLTVLGFAILPRARFIRTLAIELIGVLAAAALSTIAVLSIVAVRIRTTPKGLDPEDVKYNASASALAATWMFFLIYLISTLRSAFTPMAQLPTVLASIFVIISMVYSANFQTYDLALNYLKRFVRSFMTSLAISAIVNLFIFPQTSRDVVFADMSNYIGSLRKTLGAQVKYFQALEGEDGFTRSRHYQDGQNADFKKPDVESLPTERQEAKALSSSADALKAAHAKLVTEIKSAKEEIAWGKLQPTDISRLSALLRHVFLPVVGLTSVLHIFQRAEENGARQNPSSSSLDEQNHDRTLQQWRDTMRSLHSPMEEIVNSLDEAMEHTLLTLKLKSRSRKQRKQDEESVSNRPIPGTKGFADHNHRRIRELFDGWRAKLKLNSDGSEEPTAATQKQHTQESLQTSEDDIARFMGILTDQAHLYLTLYIEHLLWAATQAILELVEFADGKDADGTLSKWRIIVPTASRAKKWALTAVMAGSRKTMLEPHFMAPMEGQRPVHLGNTRYERKDPDHLPATNQKERIGNKIRAIPRGLHSIHSVFGLRVAIAAISVGMLGFFPQTVKFFIQERLVWGVVMLTVSFTRTAGQSLFNFCHRVFGTFLGAVASVIMYYVVVGKTAGVLVLMFFWIAACYFVILKRPQHILSCILAAVTPILVCGYELQAFKIGIPEAEKNGQVYHPTYLLAPYRLAAVAGGLAVGFFWEIFPYPISDHAELRHGLASAIYLLCNMHELVSETVKARTIGEDVSQIQAKTNSSSSLEKQSDKVLATQVLLLNQLKASSKFLRWEFVGGKFPVQTYIQMVKCTEDIMMNSALLGYASKHFLSHDEAQELLNTDLKAMLERYTRASHQVTSRLCLISSDIASGNALPPFLEPLEPMASLAVLEESRVDVLQAVQKVVPGHAALAVMQVAHRLIISDVNELTGLVKELVGELSFDFQTKQD